jgi:small subunit ribosomal protein S6
VVQRDYELGVIFNPEVSEEETRSVMDRLNQTVANYGGQIVRVNHWGRRRLAYPIERHRDGNYVFIDMILTPETVAELERTLKVSEIVLRYMARKRDARAVAKEREEREARAAAAAATPETTGEVVSESTPAETAPIAEEASVIETEEETSVVETEEETSVVEAEKEAPVTAENNIEA